MLLVLLVLLVLLECSSHNIVHCHKAHGGFLVVGG
jgi:hypothetical protein